MGDVILQVQHCWECDILWFQYCLKCYLILLISKSVQREAFNIQEGTTFGHSSAVLGVQQTRLTSPAVGYASHIDCGTHNVRLL